MSASTHIRLSDPVAVVSTSGTGYTVVLTTLPTGVQTYYLTIYNDGSDVVSVHPAGASTISQHAAKRVAAGESLTVGPLDIKDLGPRLYSATDTDCVLDLDAVTGEVS